MPNDLHVALVGLPGAGKTTVAREVAQTLNVPLIDFDAEIERRVGLPVTEIFTRHGEPHFRELELQITADCVAAPSSILSPGGGWVTQPATVALVRNRTKLVWLRVTAGEAERRLAGNKSSRPLLMNADPGVILARLAAERQNFYEASDAVIDTEVVTLQQVTKQVVELATFWGLGVG